MFQHAWVTGLDRVATKVVARACLLRRGALRGGLCEVGGSLDSGTLRLQAHT